MLAAEKDKPTDPCGMFAWACCNSTSSTANEVETEPNPFPAALRAKFNQDVQDFEVLAAAPLEVFEEEDRYYVVEIESVKDFGVLFDATGGQGLVVADVNEAGAAEAWNRANPESQIKVFDSVRNVNGKTGNATELVSELQKEVGRVRLTMRRPLEFEVYLEKQGKPLGLTLSRNTKSLGLVILGVKEGPCKEWNAAHPALPVSASDIVIQVNGVSWKDSSVALFTEIKDADQLTLKVLTYV